MKLTHSDTLSLKWLQTVIDDHWPDSKLLSFTCNLSPSQNAQTGLVYLHYEKSTQAPATLFLKLCPANNLFVIDAEVKYYTQYYLGLENSPLPQCFASGHDETGYYLLLEDLSQTHQDNKGLTPTNNFVKGVAQSFACLHAHHWGEFPGEKSIATYFDMINSFQKEAFKAFELGEGIKDLTLIKDALSNALPKLVQRLNNPRGQTRLHGDANPTNWLSPKTDQGKVYLIDHQPFLGSLRFGLATMDLTTLIIPYWRIHEREQFERDLLSHYHQHLTELGIKYPWKDLISDYKLSLIMGVFVALSWEGDTEMQWLWQTQLERSMAAISSWE